MKRICFLLSVWLFSVALPNTAVAGPDNGACRYCEAQIFAGLHHKHTAESCSFMFVNCWSCEGNTCHWGTWVYGGCDDHNHSQCMPGDMSLSAVQEAVNGGDQARLLQVSNESPESVRIDHVSGYVLVMNCSGGVTAAYRLPAQVQSA